MLVEQSAPIPFKDEIPDPGALDMWLEVDGHRYQDDNTRTMIFDVKTIVSYVSRHMTLMPGDVIPTGTPPGVGAGQKPQVFLKPGNVMRLGIAGLRSTSSRRNVRSSERRNPRLRGHRRTRS